MFKAQIKNLMWLLSLVPCVIFAEDKDGYLRHIELKLPLEKVEYHWQFLDKKQFLQGELVVHFTAQGKTVKSIIASNGQLSAQWQAIAMDESQEADENNLYFGFKSVDKFQLKSTDSATLTYTNSQPVNGWGPDFKAQLAAGTYQSTAKSITVYEDDLYDTEQEVSEAEAFLGLDEWGQRWPLVELDEDGGWQ